MENWTIGQPIVQLSRRPDVGRYEKKGVRVLCCTNNYDNSIIIIIIIIIYFVKKEERKRKFKNKKNDLMWQKFCQVLSLGPFYGT